jgi:hypothetical protein
MSVANMDKLDRSGVWDIGNINGDDVPPSEALGGGVFFYFWSTDVILSTMGMQSVVSTIRSMQEWQTIFCLLSQGVY